jgi:succinoglycan biosynthesis transport protein ExoP
MSAQRQGVVPSELHPLSIVRMFWKRKLVVGLVWILGSAIVGMVVWKLPPVYKAEALILVDSQKIPDRYVTATVSTELQDRLATIGQQITSSSQLKKIIDDFGLYKEEKKKLFQEEILDKMKKDISIVLEKGWTGNRPGAFRIGYEGPDPSVVAQVANRLANLYIEENLRVREVQAEGTSEFMDTQLTEAKKRLDELEVAVSNYKLKHNGELPQQESILSSELSRQDMALQANREAIRRAEESRKFLRDTLDVAEATVSALAQPQAQPQTTGGRAATNPATGAADSGQALSPDAKRSDLLRARLRALHDAGFADGHPDVKTAKDSLASALAEEAKEAKEAKEQAAKKPAATPGNQNSAAVDQMVAAVRTQGQTERDRAVAGARERVAALKTQIDALTQEIRDRNTDQPKMLEKINSLQTRLGSLPIREQEMAALTRDYEISKANYKAVLDKKLQAEMATDMERRQKSERFTLLDPARVPEKPAMPNRPLFAGIGSLLTLILGAVLGFGLEMRQSCILGEWELPKGVVVLGRVSVIDLRSVVAPTERPTGRPFRKLAFGLTSVFLLVVLAAGFYVVRTGF